MNKTKTSDLRLREVLQELEISQADLSRKTRIEVSSISRICTGRWNATALEKTRIALALKRKVDEIFP